MEGKEIELLRWASETTTVLVSRDRARASWFSGWAEGLQKMDHNSLGSILAFSAQNFMKLNFIFFIFLVLIKSIFIKF